MVHKLQDQWWKSPDAARLPVQNQGATYSGGGIIRKEVVANFEEVKRRDNKTYSISRRPLFLHALSFYCT